MANVNCFPINNAMKPDQPVNSQYIQKILDENVGLIHAIIDKQQQNQEAEELLKSLHKNLIYLATIADQTTSAGNSASNPPPSTPQNQYNYPQATISHPSAQTNQNYPPSVPPQTIQTPFVTQQSMVTAQTAPIETIERKPQQPSNEEAYKESHIKPEANPTMNVDMDREIEKSPHPVRESNQQIAVHKNVDIDKETCPVSQSSDLSKDISQNVVNSSEYAQKFEETVSTASSHAQNTSNIKTDMPPPSQPIGGIHQDKNQIQYPGNQRIMYPGVAPNYNQYNPHFDQNSKFYPPQNIYQQSPYNYQGMYNPYQPVAPPAAPSHYNQHMMNAPMYPQYPGYYQQPGLEQLPPPGVTKEGSLPPQQMHPPSNPMYPPNTVSQSMYPQPPQMHPPTNSASQSSMKPQSSESMPMPPAPQNPNISE